MNRLTVGGVELAYQRTGSGRTPLVLVHGYPLDHSIWTGLVPHLEGDFDLILPDLRGFGESGRAQERYGLDDMARDILGVLDHLGITQACMAGHSMGGYIALAFARAWTERVAGLGLIATQTQADDAARKKARYTTADEILAHGVLGVAEEMGPKLSPEADVQAFVRALISRQHPEGLAGALRAMADREATGELLQGVSFPVVVVHGDADALIPVERAREVRAANPEVHLVELPGVGHMPMMEAPEKVAEAVRTLLS